VKTQLQFIIIIIIIIIIIRGDGQTGEAWGPSKKKKNTWRCSGDLGA
jgi:hypothetical protein